MSSHENYFQALFVFYCIRYTILEIDGYIYPKWAEGIGWMMTLSSAVFIPVWAFYGMYIKVRSGTVKEVGSLKWHIIHRKLVMSHTQSYKQMSVTYFPLRLMLIESDTLQISANFVYVRHRSCSRRRYRRNVWLSDYMVYNIVNLLNI